MMLHTMYSLPFSSKYTDTYQSIILKSYNIHVRLEANYM